MIKVDFKDLYKFLQDNWYKKSTIIIILLSLCILLFWFFSIVEFEKYSITNFILIFILLITALIIWKASTRIPKTKKGKVGFAVAIKYDTKEEEEKITQDFTQNLKDLLSNIVI